MKLSHSLLPLAVVSLSCTTYRPVTITEAPELLEPGSSIRVTMIDWDPFETKVDSLADEGVVIQSSLMLLPYEDMLLLELEEFDGWKTAGAVLLAPVAVAGVAVLGLVAVVGGAA